jgi:hypothetical protein
MMLLTACEQTRAADETSLLHHPRRWGTIPVPS